MPNVRGIPAIRLHEQAIETSQTQEARKKTEEYRKTIEEAGIFTLKPEQIEEIHRDYPDLDLSGDIPATAAHMTAMGVKADRLRWKAENSKILTPEERDHLLNVSRVMEVIYKENPELEIYLQQAALYPRITITRIPVPETPQDLPRDVKIAFNPEGNQFRTILQSGNELVTQKAKDAASKALTKITKKAVKEGVKKVASTAGAEAGATIGSVVPVIGNIAGAALGWIAGQTAVVVLDTLKKRTQDLRDLAGGIIISGGQLAVWVVGIMWTATFEILKILLISLISLPIVIAFIFLIINNSAWVTPPWQRGLVPNNEIDSAFIDVEKIPNPSQADSAPTSITYTITISAEQSSLSNVSYAYNCTSTNESGNFNCPSEPDVVSIATETCGNSISTDNPCSFNYTVNYGAQYDNSIVSDTITVTADSEGLTGEVSTATANVIIGDPPTGCLYAYGDNWPADKVAMLNQAIVTLRNQQPTYMALVCSGPEIPVCWGPTPGKWGYYSSNSECTITIDSEGAGLANSRNAQYILSHELGHHLDFAISGSYFQRYIDSGAISELPLCTYGELNLHEGFAEGFALNAILPESWDLRCSGTFQSQYPLHYSFVRSVLF